MSESTALAEQTQTKPKLIEKLYGQQAANIELNAAIQAFRKTQETETIIGLVYSPQHCCFVRLHGEGAIQAYKGKSPLTLTLDGIFEARLFTPEAELRWLKTGPEQQGRAVIISERELAPPSGFSEVDQYFKQAFSSMEQSYVLWGEADQQSPALAEGWSLLATARIGRLPVPVNGSGEYVTLSSQEYLDCDDFGNVFVAQERLTKLEWKTDIEQEQSNG